MSLFTVAIDEKGRRFQFKTGYDRLWDFEHKIGEPLPWAAEQRAGEGHLLDGIYCAHPEDDADEPEEDMFWWVVIKGHRIIAIMQGPDYPSVEHLHPIEEPNKNLWSKEAWRQKRKEDEEREKRLEAFNAVYGSLPPENKLAVIFGQYIGEQMRRESLSAQLIRSAVTPCRNTVDPDAEPMRYKNFYRHCDFEWDDIWSSMSNDECPICGTKDIEPYRSEDLENFDPDLEWYCDSCDWVGDYNEVLYPNQPLLGGHPACPNCPSDDSIHSRKKGSMCPQCKGKGTVPDPAADHASFDPEDAKMEAQFGTPRKECSNCKGRGTV